MNWLEDLYERRFIVFVTSLAAIMFGNLLMPEAFYKNLFAPIFLVINILSGILLVYKKRRTKTFYMLILLLLVFAYVVEFFANSTASWVNYLRFTLFFLFYGLVTREIVVQVWSAQKVNETVILGVVSGYICLGLLGSFMFISIEFLEPGSFAGIATGNGQAELIQQDLLYFSYITLLTIGYGDILPVSSLAKNATVLIGLLGQFYLVIITAIVVGKFLSQDPKSST